MTAWSWPSVSGSTDAAYSLYSSSTFAGLFLVGAGVFAEADAVFDFRGGNLELDPGAPGQRVKLLGDGRTIGRHRP